MSAHTHRHTHIKYSQNILRIETEEDEPNGEGSENMRQAAEIN